MRIHHFSIPAREPERVAAVLAEVFGARVIPLPHPRGTWLVYAGDADGTAIEVWPANLRGGVGEHELEPRDLPLPEAWPHHGLRHERRVRARPRARDLRAGRLEGGSRCATARPGAASASCAGGSRIRRPSRSAAARCATSTSASSRRSCGTWRR